MGEAFWKLSPRWLAIGNFTKIVEIANDQNYWN